MRLSTKLPSYTYRTHTGLFIFRLRVPSDCRPSLSNLTELRYSLKTHCPNTARSLVASIVAYINDRIFRAARAHVSISTSSIKDGIRNLINTVLHSVSSLHAVQNIKAFPIIDVGERLQLDSEKQSNNSLERESSTSVQSAKHDNNTRPHPFSSVAKSFIKEKQATKEWRLKTLEDHQQVFRLFVEAMKDVNM